MKILAVVQLGILLIFTVAVFGQSQEARDAVQDQRIVQIERASDAHTAQIAAMTAHVSELTASLNRFTGIGIGIGSTLTILQVLQVILQVKRPK